MRDRGGRGDRPLQRVVHAAAGVGARPGSRARCWRSGPRPAPRAGPSGRPSARSSASGSGVRRRPAGTRGPARRPGRPRRSGAAAPRRCCPPPPVVPDGRQRHHLRGDHHLGGRHELPVQLHQPERVGGPHGQRPGARTDRAPGRAAGTPPPAASAGPPCRPGTAAGCPARGAPHPPAAGSPAGSRPSWPSMIWPFIGDPSGTWAGSTERSQDIRSRARETQDRRDHRQCGEQQADPHHVALAGRHGDQHDGHPGEQEHPAAHREQAPGTRHWLPPVGDVHRRRRGRSRRSPYAGRAGRRWRAAPGAPAPRPPGRRRRRG